MADSIAFAPMASATDPDAQTTVTDFVDYTEYYPSDLFRSLTLIGKLDGSYQEHITTIHNLTKAYGALPTVPEQERQDPRELRKDTSFALDQALRAREASYAEAQRLCNLTDSLCERLTGIRTKLEAQPKPPSRETTPAPQTNRRKADGERVPRIKLLTDGGARNSTRTPGSFSRRRLIIPGEVLPPRDPNSPGPSEFSDSEPERPLTPPPTLRTILPRPATSSMDKDKEKTSRISRADRPKVPKLARVRPPGVMGTNVHSTVAGISVTNAMAQLSPPPDNPPPGSKHAPWTKLTEWELHQIRKRMKKNADWMPSMIMVNRELKEKHRGEDNRRKARQQAEETGEPFFDEEPEAFVRQPLGRNHSSEPPRLTAGEEEALVNRGMKLNEAKKLKREQLLREQKEQTERGVSTGMVANGIDTNFQERTVGQDPSEEDWTTVQKDAKKVKKRKRDSSIGPDEIVPAKEPKLSKKIKLATSGAQNRATNDTDVSDKMSIRLSTSNNVNEHGALDADKGTKRASRSAAATTKLALLSADISSSDAASSNSTPGPTFARPRSRGSTGLRLKLPTTKAASAEPEKPRPSYRRRSDTGPMDAHTSGATGDYGTAASQRKSRRPAPGIIARNSDGSGVKLSIGKHKSGTKGADVQNRHGVAAETSAGEPIDPTEPTYCICNDISHGLMIACENPKCSVEWFHAHCVGLDEASTRLSRLHWYCPACRGGVDADANGIVRPK